MALLNKNERIFKEQLAFMLNLSLDCVTNNKRNNAPIVYEYKSDDSIKIDMPCI